MFRRIDLDKHGIIEASAGTGKTYTIERLVLRILTEKRVPLERILVVTFTEAAAMELRSRVRALLEQACSAGSVDDYAIPAPDIEWLRRELLGFDRAGIFTIHGFCNRVLARWPLETGLARAATITDEAALAAELCAEEIRTVWQEWDTASGGAIGREIGAGGLDALRSIVCTMAAKYVPGLVDLSPAAAAGPREFARLPEANTLAELDAALRKCAAEFLYLCKKCPRPLGGSYKKFKAGSEAGPLSWCAAAAAPAGPLPAGAVSKSLYAFGWTSQDKTNENIARAAECWDRLAGAKADHDDAAEGLHTRLVSSLAVSLRRRLDTHRIQQGLLGYNDMIRAVERALSDANSALLGRLQEQYDYGIIDEFQDTNSLQWNIFRRIFMERENGRLFVVGDPKQSIFRVQDADVYTYLSAQEHYAQTERSQRAQRYSLDFNHRSSAGLIEACNAVFSINDWFGVRGIEFVKVRPPDAPGAARDRGKNTVAGSAEKLLPAAPVVIRPLYGMPDIRLGKKGAPAIASQRCSYARYIVARIREWHAAGLPYSSMAVLYETRRYAAPLFPLLRDAGIPYTQYKESGLFASEETLSWIYLLEFLADGSARNRGRLLLSDFFGCTPEQVLAGTGDLKFDAVMDSWKELAGRRSWARLMRAVFTDTAILVRAGRRVNGKRVVAAFRQINEWIAARLIVDNLSPGDVARQLQALHEGDRRPANEEEDRFRRETEEDAVRAYTIHSSKGLQFDVVFLLAGAAKKGPNAPYVVRSEAGKRRDKILLSLDPAHGRPMAEEEEFERRRLLYVGCTRARYKMVLPLWKIPEPGERKGTGDGDRLPAYDRNVLAASRRRPDCFFTDASPLEKVPLPRGRPEAQARPRADAFTATDSEDLNAAEERLLRLVGGLGIAGRKRFIHSYSSLVHGGSAGRVLPAVRAAGGPDGPPSLLPKELRLDPGAVLYAGPDRPQALPLPMAGKNAGSALHEILEGLDFSDVNNREDGLRRRIEYHLAAHGLLAGSGGVREETCRQVAALIDSVLDIRLPFAGGGTMRVRDIRKKDLLSESYFSAGVNRASGRLDSQNGRSAVPDSVLGFIDCIFRQGRDLYILDWKSDSLDSYDCAALLEEMNGSGYTVQAALYAIVLERWLSTRFGNSGYAVRGVCYVFLRGPAAITIPCDSLIMKQWEQGLSTCFRRAVRENAAEAGGTHD